MTAAVSLTTRLIRRSASLYPLLYKMEKRGWIESEWGQSENKRKAKFYQLTPAGRKQLKVASEDWSRYAEAVFKVLQATKGEVSP